MRTIFLIFSCCSALAQLPVIPWSIPPRGGPFTPCGTLAYAPPTNSLFIELFTDDPVSFTNAVEGSVVSNWFDVSGHSYNFTNGIESNVGDPFARVTTFKTPSGCSSIDFSGNAVMKGLGFGFDFQTNQPITWYVVSQIDNANNGWVNTFEVMMDGGNASFRNIYANSFSSTPFWYSGSLKNLNHIAETNWMVWTFQFNGASSFIRTNGVSFATDNPGAQGISKPRLGVDINHGGNNFVGRMSAVLVYGTNHTTGQMQAIEAGLKTRYSLP